MKTGSLLRALVLALFLLPAAIFGQDFSDVRIEPARPTPEDPVRIAVTIGGSSETDLHLVGIQGNRIVFQYTSYDEPSGGPPQPFVAWTIVETVGPLPAGVYTVEVRAGNDLAFQHTFEVTKPAPALVLQESEDGAFTVTVDYDLPQGPAGTGQGVPLTRESGYFWFFSPQNIELTIKILDGRGVNGRYWVFISSMTDLPFTVTIQQCPASPLVGQPCNVKTYTNPKGVNRNVLDVNAFPTL